MEHIAAIMLLIGCADDLSLCREIRVEVPFHETVAECERQIEPAMVAVSDRYPQLFGQCLEVDPADEHADNDLVWNVNVDGVLVAAFRSPDIMIASASPDTGTRERLRSGY